MLLPPFLFMVIPPLRPISRIGLFFLYQPRELSWTVHRLSNMFSILYDSLRFTIVLSTQIGKWTLQNKIPVLRTLSVPSSRLFLACRIFSFWNFHFPIFSYDLWNSSESLQSSRKLFFFCPTCRIFDFQNFDFWKKAYDFWKHGIVRFHHFQAVSVISNLW